MSRNKKKNIRIGAVLGIAFLMVMMVTSVYFYEDEQGKVTLKMNTAMAEYGLPAGESGWLEIYIMPHDTSPATTYDENTSATLEGNALTYADTDGWTKTIDSETLFDIVVRVRVNATHARNATMFKLNRINCSLNVSGDFATGSDFSDVDGTPIETANNSAWNFIYVNFYWDNSGSGYSVDDDGTLTFDAPQLYAKF